MRVAVVDNRTRAKNQLASRLDTHRAIGNHPLQPLIVGERTTKSAALFHVTNREVERALSDAHSLSANGRATAIERVHCHRESLTNRADAMRVGDAHIVESNDSGRRSLDAKFVLELVDLDTPLGLHQERGEAGVAIGRRAREHRVEIADASVGDPAFRTIQNPRIAIGFGLGGHRGHVAAGIGFAERVAGLTLAAANARDVGALELFATKVEHRQHRQLADQKHQAGGCARR